MEKRNEDMKERLENLAKNLLELQTEAAVAALSELKDRAARKEEKTGE